jgi:hypothetical protein
MLKAYLVEIGGSATTQEHADKIANFKDLFGQLEARADTTRKDEKEPHLSAGRAVDAKWKPIVELAETAKRAAAKNVVDYLISERQKAQVLKAALEAELRAAEPDAPVFAEVTIKPVRAGTQGKRRLGLKTQQSVQIDDASVLIGQYINDPRFYMNGDILNTLKKIALIDLKSGKELKGVTLIETQVAF